MTDYTKKRASKTIKPCPKCGRNGRVRHLEMDTYRRIDGVKVPHRAEYDSYYHVTERSDMGCVSVREHCTVNYVVVPMVTKSSE